MKSDMSTSISLADIEVILNALIVKMKKMNLKGFSFDDDLYWNIPMEGLNEFPEQPKLSIGSINDDISFLNSLIVENYDTDFLELERLSSLFRFLAKKLSNNEA